MSDLSITACHPQYFDRLTQPEQAEYLKLKSSIARVSKTDTVISRGPRAQKTADYFQKLLDAIKAFAVTANPLATQRRSLVCGIIWCRLVIAINTRQLSILLDKSKSSVNIGFTVSGYEIVKEDPETVGILAGIYPFFRSESESDRAQCRQWTYRSIPAHLTEISFSGEVFDISDQFSDLTSEQDW
jgi:hypothetical protein